VAIEPNTRRAAGRSVHAIAAAFRRLPVPVIGRIQDDTFVLDVRCLDDEPAFLAQVAQLDRL
jgi:L-seryl-tRNA(Ser) seleniumtransferase